MKQTDFFLPRAAAIALMLATGMLASQPQTEHWPQIETAQDATIEAFVDQTLQKMTLEQKIGQVIQAEIQFVSPEDVHRFGLGSVLNGGGSFPGQNRRAAVSDWTRLSSAYHEAALRPMRDGLPAIPLVWGTDAVHGHNNVFGATVFPHNIALGATRSPELVEAISRATAADIAATGIDWNFAPTLAVVQDLRWGRSYEGFSSDPEWVSILGRAAIVGLQGEPGAQWLGKNRVIATAKHFVGDGGTTDGIDQGDTQVDEKQLATVHGLPYVDAIEAGVQTVMASFSSWNGLKMHGHRYLLTDVLKGRMGFDGFIVGDWNGHAQVSGCSVTDCLQAFEAGIDMFMVPEDWREFHRTLLEHARAGRVSQARLDDAVRRILRVKKRAGLFDAKVRGAAKLPDPAGHAELARQAVRESLVLLKNDNQLLPIDPGQRVLVVGAGADDIGKQSGGWTLDWQGVTETNESFPNGQSIYDGISEWVTAAGGQVQLGEAGAADFGPDVVIAVIGENPYAEGPGDVATLEFQPGSRDDLELLQRLGNMEVPVITVFLSGRPMWVNPEINQSDAFIAAWLPGTEGGGVADVLLADASGKPRFEPGGKLPFAWPAEPEPGPDGQLAELFAFGYGLDYAAHPNLPRLPETGLAPRLEAAADELGLVAFDGLARDPWRLVLREAGAPEVAVGGQTETSAGSHSIRLAPTDRHLQGDARRITWTGATPAAVALAVDEPQALQHFLARQSALVFELRLEADAPQDLTVGMECGESCGAAIALAPLLKDMEAGDWQQVRIDLACLASEGVELARVTGLFVLSADGPLELSFADVRLEPGGAAGATQRCGQ
ncbi:MAG: exo 1,3/1,4-beta-D-glucan glucohydrolase [Wenzhouxiangellaceae bacterium]|nr:exo 1,3/1,4-beta-D-glucan glucohydrolase [Wenzhouxiangellaceae bacterium]